MRPPSFSLSLTALLTLPYRLCNPPPAAGNVRSCKVTPLIKVSLDDVLNKRHLPPLTLKDFEEWLVFVEGCPQYLYFILWLKEYESRYAAWLAESGCTSPSSKSASTTTISSPAASSLDLSYINLIPSSPPLALFFTRAKQTFLDPASPYALGPDALAALIAASAPSTHSLSPSIPAFTVPAPDNDLGLPSALVAQPHPHPKDLVALATFCRTALKPRVERFAQTACHNVGTRRAWCGIAGGSAIVLLLGLLPALVALFCARERWWRVVGWLGCWLGGTIVVSSFHGICMMIYIFGDLRQLRSFELARPAISPPRAIARARPRLKSLLDTETEHEHEHSPTTSSSRPPSHSTTTSKSAPKLTPRPRPRITIPAPALTKPLKHAQTWSATSTGTPVVHLRPGAFAGMDVGVVSDASTDEVVVASGEGIGGVDREAEEGEAGQGQSSDFGIQISPAYYYPEEKAGVVDVAASGSGSGSESRVGMVMQWVMGRRNGTESENGHGKRSHAGTFGVRSWRARGGLGSLPGLGSVSEPGRAGDVENEKEKGDLELGAEAEVRTAAFIPGAYDEGKEVTFDFDSLPGTRVRSPLPVLYAHPGARVVTPSPSPGPGPGSVPLSPPPSPSTQPETEKDSKTEKPRQWWDTCPRHPAVEALAPAPVYASPVDASFPAFPVNPPYAAPSFPAPSNTPVPPFAPVTRVLEPLAARGQWEIVMRSACVAALGAWVVVGCIVAVPGVV